MPGDRQSPPAMKPEGSKSFGGDGLSVSGEAVQRVIARRVELGQYAGRLIEEALIASLPASWERRAAEFEWARHRPGDFPGRATAAELEARARDLTEAAAACRERAELLRRHPDMAPGDMVDLVADALAERGIAA